MFGSSVSARLLPHNPHPYLDYRVLDENGGDVEKSTVSSGKNLTESNLKNYAIGMIISYDANGKPSVNIRKVIMQKNRR